MMTTFTRKTVLAALVLVGGVACTDVAVEPRSTVSSSNIFNEPGSYRAFIAKIYGGLQTTGSAGPTGNSDIRTNDEGFSHYVRLVWQMQELPTDEAGIAWNDDGVQQLNTQLWTSSNPFLTSMYFRVFFQVTLANEFLRETSDARLAQRRVTGALATEIQRFRAEARYLRALSYWHGLDLFGDIPLVTEANELGRTPPQQASREEVFAYVVSELIAIRSALPPAGTGGTGRADQGAVAMLLAKLYLNAEVYTGTARYTEARTEAERVIAGAYSIDPNFRRIFSADNHTSPEIIFSVPQDGLRTQSFGGTTFLTHAAVGGSMNAADFGLDGGWFGLRLKPQILALYPGGGGPASPDRRSAFFFFPGQTTTMANITDFSSGIPAPKYTNVTSTGTPGASLQFADTDYPMFRLADAFLMYAETVTRGAGGSRATALGYINTLRQRAYGNTSGNITDAQLTTNFILDERARELLWEGHRRTDLVRYNRFTTAGLWAWKGNVLAGRVTESFRNLYPLPAAELAANPNLTQNTGY